MVDGFPQIDISNGSQGIGDEMKKTSTHDEMTNALWLGNCAKLSPEQVAAPEELSAEDRLRIQAIIDFWHGDRSRRKTEFLLGLIDEMPVRIQGAIVEQVCDVDDEVM